MYSKIFYNFIGYKYNIILERNIYNIIGFVFKIFKIRGSLSIFKVVI